jgi:hypothetical protein
VSRFYTEGDRPQVPPKYWYQSTEPHCIVPPPQKKRGSVRCFDTLIIRCQITRRHNPENVILLLSFLRRFLQIFQANSGIVFNPYDTSQVKTSSQSDAERCIIMRKLLDDENQHGHIGDLRKVACSGRDAPAEMCHTNCRV